MGDEHAGEPHLIISVSCPGDPPARLPTWPTTLHVVRLQFSDTDSATGLHESVAHELFTREQAASILRAVKRHANAERIIVHCGAGLSRSPAIAAALTKILGGDDSGYFKRYMPNMWVYRLLLEEHRSQLDAQAPSGAGVGC